MSPSLARPVHRLPPRGPGDADAVAAGTVDLWCFFYAAVSDGGLWHDYLGLMSAAERERHRAFHFERDRRMFLAARALVRTVLSTYADRAPAEWHFGAGARGKPEVEAPPGGQPLYFNLAHTAELVVCAVSRRHQRLGVDVESTARPVDLPRMAHSCLSPAEQAALNDVPAVHRPDRFFSYWTLKEAYIKARGLGLALPLERFSILLDKGPDIGMTIDPSLRDDAARWRFVLLDAAPAYRIAVAADTGGLPLVVRAMNHVPLWGTRPWQAAGA